MSEEQTPHRRRRTPPPELPSQAGTPAPQPLPPQAPAVTPTYQRRREARPASAPVSPSAPQGYARTPVKPPAAPAARTPVQPPAAPAARTVPSEAPERPEKKHGLRAAHVMIAALVVFLVCSGLVTAELLMRSYLRDREAEWAEAQQRVVDNHPLYYKDAIEQSAGENNLHPAYVAAIILNESSFRPEAESKVGARGLMQLMPDTAEWVAHKLGDTGYSFSQLFDPAQNIRYGCWYLKYLSELFRGDPVLVTAAYHAGQGQVTSWLSDRSISPDGISFTADALPDGPTKTYVRKVTRAYGIYKKLYYTPADDSPAAPADAASPALAARR